MPGRPDPARNAFAAMLTDFEQRLRALETQQQLVVSDPTGATGDPKHGHAVVVVGNITPITNLTSVSTGRPLFGIASYQTGTWVQL